MQYNGIDLDEMSPEKWDGKSREMIVWCDNVSDPVHYGNICYIKNVIGYNPRKCAWVVDDKRLDYWPKCAEIPEEESDKQQTEIVTEYSLNVCINSLKYHFKSKNEDSPDDEIECPSLKESYESIIKYLDELKSLKEDRVEPTPFEDVLLTRIKVLKEENEELKAKIAPLRSERVKMADSVSSAVWKELMNRDKTIEGPVNTTMAGFGFNDISDIVLNKIMEYKPIDKPEKKLRRMTYKELDEWLEQGKGVVKIGDKVRDTISYDCEDRNHEVSGYYKISGYDEDTWHEPLINEYLGYKSEDKSENTQRGMIYRAFAEWLSHGDFGFNGISDISVNNIINYKPETKPRRMTNHELAEWLSKGNGQFKHGKFKNGNYESFRTELVYCNSEENAIVDNDCLIRGWNETEWHEPFIEE